MSRKKAHKPREEVLLQALEDVTDREETYGPPLLNHTRIAIMFSAWQSCKSPDAPVTPLDSIVFQILTNLARLAQTPEHKGTWDNIAGYSAIGYEVHK